MMRDRAKRYIEISSMNASNKINKKRDHRSKSGDRSR
jgi:hypothetical protein